MDLHTVYQDNHLFVVKKEHNMTIDALDECVKLFLSTQKQKIGYLQRLTSLDSLACGLVVYALTSKAYDRLKEQDFAYKFLTINIGAPNVPAGYFSANVEDLGNGKLGLAPPIKQSFKVDFYYKLIEKYSSISLLEFTKNNFDTLGLRFGAKQLKCPVFGDKLYEGDVLAPNTNLAMVLYCIEFEHPTTHSRLVLKCSPTEDAKPWSYFNLDKFYKN
ncbi:MAG: hypothetical protein IJU58_01845 [Clostridia bacterium]|nr:hypothetical protein [Clostridia bacterium]